MAIVGNYSVLNKTPGRWLAGSSAAGAAFPKARGHSHRASEWRNFGFPDHSGAAATVTISNTCLPTGYYPPGSWALPIVAGEISSLTLIQGVGTATASGALGRNIASGLTGVGDITLAELGLIVQLFADLDGVGELDAAILGKLGAAADLVGDGNLEGAADALAWVAAAIAGEGDAAATSHASGSLSADIRSYGDLTPENVANRVWGYLIEGNYSALQELRLMASVLYGKTSIDEGPPVIVGFDNLESTKARVAAEMDGSTRVSVTLDPD